VYLYAADNCVGIVHIPPDSLENLPYTAAGRGAEGVSERLISNWLQVSLNFSQFVEC
jgi:hypothetical protein